MLKAKKTIFLITLLGLTACTHQPLRAVKDGAPVYVPPDITSIPDAIPKHEAYSKYGNPQRYTVNGKQYLTKETHLGYDEKGVASWYGTKFHGQRTSSGEPYDMFGMTAAHKSLPLPSYVRVTNLNNGRQVVVKVNDRGPFEKNRLIDLSYAAAKKLDMLKQGTALVEVKAIHANEVKHVPNLDRKVANHAHPQLFIQLGAFSQMRYARSLENRVKPLTHYPIRVSQARHHGVKQYKVQIGPLASVETTDALTHHLRHTGFPGAWTTVQ